MPENHKEYRAWLDRWTTNYHKTHAVPGLYFDCKIPSFTASHIANMVKIAFDKGIEGLNIVCVNNKFRKSELQAEFQLRLTKDQMAMVEFKNSGAKIGRMVFGVDIMMDEPAALSLGKRKAHALEYNPFRVNQVHPEEPPAKRIKIEAAMTKQALVFSAVSPSTLSDINMDSEASELSE